MEVDNPVEEDPATQASPVLNIPATPGATQASLLDPQHGEASQPAPTPAHASQTPQPAPATREKPPAARGNVPTPPPIRTRTRSLRPSADRKELLLCVKDIQDTLKTSSDKQQNSMAELKELLSCIAARDRERHEMDMEIKRERLNVLRLKRIELERRLNNE